MNTPAGWYNCPQNPHTLRYWNGTEWTHHTSPTADKTNTWENRINDTLTNPKTQTTLNQARNIKETLIGIIFLIVGIITAKTTLEHLPNQNYLPAGIPVAFTLIGIHLIIKNIRKWTQQ